MYHYRTKITIPKGKQLILIPIGDVQGDEQLDRLDSLIQWCLEQQKAGHVVRVFFTGDLFETHSPSERVKLAGANLHETTLDSIHGIGKAQADGVVGRFKALKGKIMLALQGHHWINIKIGGVIMSSDQYIAEKLDAEYAGDGIAIIEMLINGLPFNVMAMHGYGVGRQPGGRINKRLQMRDVVANCNLYFQGHDNEKIAVTKEPMLVENGEIKAFKQVFAGIGCYQESYHIGRLEAGYAEKVAYPPAVIGSVIAFVRMTERHGKPRLDYHVSV